MAAQFLEDGRGSAFQEDTFQFYVYAFFNNSTME